MKRKSLFKKLLSFSLLGVSCVSCATIVNGTTQKVSISSDPLGASIFVDGAPAGCTPNCIELKRKREHLISLSKEGFEDENVKLEPVLSGAVAGNIIAGGFIGWGVDAVSGSQYRLIPETVNVRMRPRSPILACPPSCTEVSAN